MLRNRLAREQVAEDHRGGDARRLPGPVGHEPEALAERVARARDGHGLGPRGPEPRLAARRGEPPPEAPGEPGAGQGTQVAHAPATVLAGRQRGPATEV